ncbi:MAG: hypothetical protein ACRDVG_09570 [Jatrophihabitantaceae bacterium]
MSYVPMPPPPAEPQAAPVVPPAGLRPVVVLLLTNLGLSVLLTMIVIVLRHSLVTYQLDHQHVTDPDRRRLLRDSYSYSIIARVVGNVVVSVVYAFLVRALLRGRRWAYRRVVLLGAFGIVALGLLWLTPYPWWMRVEQVVQSLVLAALLWFVTRPEIREHFRTNPQAHVKRFGRK